MSDVKCICVNLESDNNLSHNLSTSTQENSDTISEAPLPLEDNRNDDNNTIIESNSPLKEDGYESNISYHDMNVDSSESDSKSAATASDSGHTVNGDCGAFDAISHDAFDPRSFFNLQNGFSPVSSAFFVAEHANTGDGKKYIVSRALFRKEGTKLDCEQITETQLNLAFHSCERYYKMTSGEIANVCSMVQEEKNAAEERQSLLHNHLIEELSQSLRSLQIHPGVSERIINESITRGQIRYLRKINEESLPEIRDANSVRKYYTGKGISMVKQLPRPEVQIKTLEVDREYAFIDPVELVNHVFAVGVDCHYYRAGYDEDWDPNKVDDKRSPYM